MPALCKLLQERHETFRKRLFGGSVLGSECVPNREQPGPSDWSAVPVLLRQSPFRPQCPSTSLPLRLGSSVKIQRINRHRGLRSRLENDLLAIRPPRMSHRLIESCRYFLQRLTTTHRFQAVLLKSVTPALGTLQVPRKRNASCAFQSRFHAFALPNRRTRDLVPVAHNVHLQNLRRGGRAFVIRRGLSRHASTGCYPRGQDFSREPRSEILRSNSPIDLSSW